MILKVKLLLLLAILSLGGNSFAQLLQDKQTFSRADSLRGQLSPLRTCYDINFYHLDVKVDIDNKFISGSNLFRFTATQDFDRVQVDLFENMKISKIVYRGRELPFRREFNAVFIDFPAKIKKGSRDEFTVQIGRAHV